MPFGEFSGRQAHALGHINKRENREGLFQFNGKLFDTKEEEGNNRGHRDKTNVVPALRDIGRINLE
jgi:hypothetical protein